MISANVDEPEKFDVVTLLDNIKVDAQTATKASELTDTMITLYSKKMQFCRNPCNPIDRYQTVKLQGHLIKHFWTRWSHIALTHWLSFQGGEYQALYAFTKRLRDEMGIKFQTVLFNKAADYEGVINLKNKVTDADEASLVYWFIRGIRRLCRKQIHCQQGVRMVNSWWIQPTSRVSMRQDWTQGNLFSIKSVTK